MRRAVAMSSVVCFALSAVSPALPQTQRGAAARTAADQQKVLPPEARYWMGATTGSGIMAMMNMAPPAAGQRPSVADAMRMGMNGIPTESRSVELKLGSTLEPRGAPEAVHTMPPAAKVNKPIFLKTPEPTGSVDSVPTGYKPPKGQIKFYWGCGEQAGPGQPVVLTFDKLLRGENDPELNALSTSVAVREVSKPSPGTSRTYGDWPNGDPKNRGLEAKFPPGATLAGQHVIEGNYTPRIEFALADNQSFLDPVSYTNTGPLPSGAVSVTWAPVSRATGYALGVMAPERVNDDSADMVMWSSANRPATFIVMEDLAPAEVQRLIGLQAVLPPQTTTCVVPAEVVKSTKEGSMLMFTAFGDQATFVYPPRPEDPRVVWDQEWFARVSYKAARMDMISPQGVQDMGAMAGGGQAAMSDEEYCRMLEAQQGTPSAAEVIGRSTGIPGAGLLGRALGGKKKEQPADPRCPKR